MTSDLYVRPGSNAITMNLFSEAYDKNLFSEDYAKNLFSEEDNGNLLRRGVNHGIGGGPSL